MSKLLGRKIMDKTRNSHGLTQGQEDFARVVAEYVNQPLVDSYLMAYPNFDGSRKTAMEQASRLMSSAKIRQRVEMLRAVLVATCPMSRVEASSILAEIARDAGFAPDTRIRAVRNIAELSGWMRDQGDQATPEAIQITIVTDDRAKPSRDLTITTDGEVINVE